MKPESACLTGTGVTAAENGAADHENAKNFQSNIHRLRHGLSRDFQSSTHDLTLRAAGPLTVRVNAVERRGEDEFQFHVSMLGSS